MTISAFLGKSPKIPFHAKEFSKVDVFYILDCNDDSGKENNHENSQYGIPTPFVDFSFVISKSCIAVARGCLRYELFLHRNRNDFQAINTGAKQRMSKNTVCKKGRLDVHPLTAASD